jgi:ribose transport system substrate-binding protein
MVQGRIVSFASLAVVAVVVSGCGSNGEATPAKAGGASAAGVTAAKAATEKALAAPTTIPLTEPLKSKPPTGKTFAWMKCELVQCLVQADALKEATAALGWTYKELPFQTSDPATLVSAMKQALTYHPIAVGEPSIPQALWQSVVPEYKATGVLIVPSFVGAMKYDDTVIGQAGANDTAKSAEILANWAIADSGGKAHVLLETVNDFPVVAPFAAAYKDTLEKNCPACSVTVVNNTIPQIGAGQVPGTLVAALQKDPSINYLVTCNGAFITGLVPALAAAGLSDRVKISGEAASTTNLTDVRAGKESAFTSPALSYLAWTMVDIVLRHMQGMSFQPDGDGGLPVQLLTKDVDFQVADTYDKPADWRDQLKKLWLVE